MKKKKFLSIGNEEKRMKRKMERHKFGTAMDRERTLMPQGGVPKEFQSPSCFHDRCTCCQSKACECRKSKCQVSKSAKAKAFNLGNGQSAVCQGSISWEYMKAT